MTIWGIFVALVVIGYVLARKLDAIHHDLRSMQQQISLQGGQQHDLGKRVATMEATQRFIADDVCALVRAGKAPAEEDIYPGVE